MHDSILAGLISLLLAAGLNGAYTGLVATSDGNAVYFRSKTGSVGGGVYVLRSGAAEAFRTGAPYEFDVDASATVVADSVFTRVICNSGSTCSMNAKPCFGGFQIRGPGLQIKGPDYVTFLRLDRSGKLAWIEQSQNCYSFPESISRSDSPRFEGLYEISPFRQVAAGQGAPLANRRSGRRLITDRARVLTFVGAQLTWLDATGRHAIRHVAGAFEAVTDAAGNNIVYVEAESGRLHWIDTVDRDLGVTGSAPVLSDDGSRLYFLAPDGSLQIHERGATGARSLGSDTYAEFVLSDGAVFAVTTTDHIVRIDLATESTSTWLDPFPEVLDVDAPQARLPWVCPWYCYDPPQSVNLATQGMVLTLRGRYLDEPGWRVHTVGIGSVPPVYPVDLPLQPVWSGAAWFQVPDDIPLNGQNEYHTLELYKVGHPITSQFRVQVQQTAVSCIMTVHEDFATVVSASTPAQVGEIVHVYLTGLAGSANPPTLNYPQASEIVAFGPLPGWIGLQQLDLRVLGASPRGSQLFATASSFGCLAPPVAN